MTTLLGNFLYQLEISAWFSLLGNSKAEEAAAKVYRAE